jgi:hypothetical protein
MTEFEKGIRGYIAACEKNLAELLVAEVRDEAAIRATKRMIDTFYRELDKTLGIAG